MSEMKMVLEQIGQTVSRKRDIDMYPIAKLARKFVKYWMKEIKEIK